MTGLGAVMASLPALLADQSRLSEFLGFTVFGIVLAAIYFIAASGLVVTYTTSGMFNFAHGAVGMIGAFTYWQLVVSWGWPVVPSLLIILLVIAPLLGVFIERVVMRGLQGVSEVTRTVVSIALLFSLIRVAPMIWGSKNTYKVPAFFAGNSVEIAGVGVTYHQLVTIAIAIGVAVFLRWLLFLTRLGVAMRAVVDSRPLSRLNGARPERTSAASWALGSSLAALAGILVAERIVFDVVALTFLVVNAYAAAVVGRLTSLTRTFVGAVVLALVQSYGQGYLQENPAWLPKDLDVVNTVSTAVPVVLLLVVLLLIPQARLRAAGIQRSREAVPHPKIRLTLIGVGSLVAVVALVSLVMGGDDRITWSKGLALAIIMLSLVPLTGYGGQISLAQMSFAGLGAYAVATWGDGSPVGLLAAVVIAAAAGVLVALPALRLSGIYLALATLAFAYFVEKVVFPQRLLFPTATKPVKRLNLFGLSLDDDRAYMVFLAVVFGLLTVGIVLLRLGPFGRRLQAMKDSPAACATLGLNLTRTKLQVFVLSSAIAGLGGGLYAGVGKAANTIDYSALQNLPVLLMAVAGGVALCSGALVGGLLLASFGLGAKSIPSIEVLGVDSKTFFTNLFALAPGLIGIALGRNPNGIVAGMSEWARAKYDARFGAGADDEVDLDRLPRLPLEPVLDVEHMGLFRAFSADEVAAIDAVVRVDVGKEMAHAAP